MNFTLDGNILLFIQNHLRTPLFDRIFLFITSLGDKGILWIILALLLMIPKKTRKIGITCALALVLSVVFNNHLLKNLIQRPRPFTQINGLVNLRTPLDPSFPSGHTGSSFAAAVVIFMQMPKRCGIPAMLAAVLIAFSRLYIGVHYPTDVLGGMLTGTLIAFLSQWIINGIFQKISPKQL